MRGAATRNEVALERPPILYAATMPQDAANTNMKITALDSAAMNFDLRAPFNQNYYF
jgi:hypothetical protein